MNDESFHTDGKHYDVGPPRVPLSHSSMRTHCCWRCCCWRRRLRQRSGWRCSNCDPSWPLARACTDQIKLKKKKKNCIINSQFSEQLLNDEMQIRKMLIQSLFSPLTEMLRRRRQNSLNWWYRPLELTSWAAVGYSLDLMTFAVYLTEKTNDNIFQKKCIKSPKYRR